MFDKDLAPKKLFFVILGFLIPMLAARASRRVVGKSYEMLTHEEVPKNPADSSVGWKNALVWAVLSGAIAGVSRMGSRRLLSETIIPSEGDDMDGEMDDLG